MTAWLYKWLPIFCGCHCRPDRSFFWRGRQFPVCARCTGELAGILLLLLTWYWRHLGTAVSFCLLVPLVVDGGVQLATRYESHNLRRLWTGVLFGYGLTNLVFLSMAWVYHRGFDVGLKLQGLG